MRPLKVCGQVSCTRLLDQPSVVDRPYGLGAPRDPSPDQSDVHCRRLVRRHTMSFGLLLPCCWAGMSMCAEYFFTTAVCRFEEDLMLSQLSVEGWQIMAMSAELCLA